MKYELETRNCANRGCKRTFKVLPSSDQKVCARFCSSNIGFQVLDQNPSNLATNPRKTK